MIDTANLYLPFDRVRLHDPFTYLPQFIDEVTEHYPANREPYTTGRLGGNYRLSFNGLGLSLKGSAAKFYHQGNFIGLDKPEFQEAIELMSDTLHLPIHRANITRIDLTHTFETKYPPEAYYSSMGECKFYQRNPLNNSLYYSNPNKTKCFYNKNLEAKKNKSAIPEFWQGRNALRFEFRFEHKIAQQLKISQFNPESLSQNTVYLGMVRHYFKEYNSINKLNNLTLNDNYMKTPKDITKQLELLGIESLGGQANAIKLIEDLRLKGAFEKPEYYSRAKKHVNDLCKTPNLTAPSELIIELDQKFKELKESIIQ